MSYERFWRTFCRTTLISKSSNQSPKGIFPYNNVKILTEFDLAQTVGESFYYHGPLLRAEIPGSGTDIPNTSTVCEFMLEDSDAIIIDYSLCDKLAYPNVEQPVQPGLYKRSGTIWLIADRLSANVRDDYVELNTSIPGQSGVSFFATISGDQTDIGSLKISLMAQNIESTKTITLSCRRWRS